MSTKIQDILQTIHDKEPNLNFDFGLGKFLYDYSGLDYSFSDFFCDRNFMNFLEYNDWVNESLATYGVDSECFWPNFIKHFKDFQNQQNKCYIDFSLRQNSDFYSETQIILDFLNDLYIENQAKFFEVIKDYDEDLANKLMSL